MPSNVQSACKHVPCLQSRGLATRIELQEICQPLYLTCEYTWNHSVSLPFLRYQPPWSPAGKKTKKKTTQMWCADFFKSFFNAWEQKHTLQRVNISLTDPALTGQKWARPEEQKSKPRLGWSSVQFLQLMETKQKFPPQSGHEGSLWINTSVSIFTKKVKRQTSTQVDDSRSNCQALIYPQQTHKNNKSLLLLDSNVAFNIQDEHTQSKAVKHFFVWNLEQIIAFPFVTFTVGSVLFPFRGIDLDAAYVAFLEILISRWAITVCLCVGVSQQTCNHHHH